MADIMIDNWTLQRAAISINDTYEKISSPNEEYVKLIEALVLWDHVYFIDNEYSQYWKKFLYRLHRLTRAHSPLSCAMDK